MTVPSGVVRVRLTRRGTALERQGARNRLRVGERRRVILSNLGHELGILCIRACHRLQNAAVGEHRRRTRVVIARKQREFGRARVVDRIDARNLAGLKRTVRIGCVVELVDLEQLVVAFLGKRRRHVLKSRSVPGLIRYDGHRNRVDRAVGAEVRKHKHEHRGKRDGKESAPDPRARPAQQRLDRGDDGVEHGCPLVAQLAAGDLEEHVVEGRWLAHTRPSATSAARSVSRMSTRLCGLASQVQTSSPPDSSTESTCSRARSRSTCSDSTAPTSTVTRSPI